MTSGENLKPGWKIWRFDQIAINVNARIDNPSEAGVEHYVGLEHLDPDSLKIRRWGKPEDVEATKLCFKKGDIIFGRRRAYQRKLGVANFDGICSAHAMVLRPRTDVVLPEFLPYFIQSDLFMKRAIEISVGSLSPTINWKTLAVQQFALPPLDEQRRTAKVLDAIEEQLEAIKNAAEVGRSLEKTTFVHSLRGAFHEHSGKLKESCFGMVPLDWPLVPVNKIASVAYGISESVASNKDPSIGWPILTGANITLNGTLDFQKDVYIEAPTKEDFKLKYGDLLLNWRSGSQEHVGKTAIFVADGDYTFASFILRIRVDDKTNRKFIWRLLNHMREFQLFGGSTSQQVNFKMNAAMFREVGIIAPPRAIQNEIVQQLENFEQVLSALEVRKRQTRNIKTAIMMDVA